MKKKLKVLLGMASLMMATMIGSTWATDTKSIMTGNEFQTAYYRTEIIDEFYFSDEWKPGVEADKIVGVENYSNIPVIARIDLAQKWEEILGDGETNTKEFPLTFVTKDGETEYAALINFSEDVVMLGDEDSSNPFNVKYVKSIEDAKEKWLLASGEPEADGSWYAYYIGVVEPAVSEKQPTRTPYLFESVTMNPKIQNDVISTTTRYEKQPDGSYKTVTETKRNASYGYENAKYTLTVTMTTVQATKDAVKDVFKGSHKEIVDYLVKDVAQTGVYVAEGEKVLTMKEKDGTLGYVPYRKGREVDIEEGNWFMSFTDMIPGAVYKDEMKIENDTYYNFHLYMKAVPREQSEVKDELLELITMKVYHDGTLIYEGTASGAKNALEKSLQETVYLGYYSSQNDGKIEVELQLDPDMSLDDAKYLDANGRFKYADVLSKIDWQFWVVRKTSSRTPDPKPTVPTTASPTPTEPPVRDVITDEYDPFGVLGEFNEMIPVGVLGATGDDTPILPVVAAMLVCAGFMAFVIARRKKESYEE